MPKIRNQTFSKTSNFGSALYPWGGVRLKSCIEFDCRRGLYYEKIPKINKK